MQRRIACDTVTIRRHGDPDRDSGPRHPTSERPTDRSCCRSSPLFQLYLTRLRDFYRQPARIFWVYGFPTLLAIVLGFAFQNRPPAPIQVDLIEGPGSSWIKAALEAHNAALERERAAGHPRLDVPPVAFHEAPEAEAMKRLKTGKTPLVIEPPGSESWAYRYDPTRPEAAAARQAVDDILQQAAGPRRIPSRRRTSTSPSPAHGTSTS